ncbi:MAG: hypothetical protein AAFV53_34155 [Myxococcota bacterium]
MTTKHSEVAGLCGRYRLNLDAPRGGGQATVYPALDDQSATVAVKIARDRTTSRWIARERDALLDIASRSADSGRWVVSLLDHGVTADGRIFLVLPWFSHSLRGWVQETAPSAAQRLRSLEHADEAVIRLHLSVDDLASVRVHRDIKPDNFLVEETDGALSVVLADLGGVKAGRLLATGHHTTLHTPNYAPPEQTLPIEQAPDPAMDVHALAATVFWVLTGAPPAAILARPSCFTAAGIRLCQLLGQRPRDEDEFATLRQKPLNALFDFSQARPLFVEDEAMLRQALTRMTDLSTANAILSRLLPSLRHALEPDPQRRAGDARKLLAACTLSRERLATPAPTIQPAPPTPSPSPQTILVPEPTAPTLSAIPIDRRPSHWPLGLLAMLFLLLFGGATITGAGMVGMVWSQIPAADPNEAPTEPEAVPVNGKPPDPEEAEPPLEEAPPVVAPPVEEAQPPKEGKRGKKSKRGKRSKPGRRSDDDDDNDDDD